MNFENMGSEAWTLIATYGIRVVGVLVALFAAWVVSGMAKRALLKVFARSNFDATLSKFFSNMARYSILTFAVVGCLEVFGIETSSFAAVIAAAGLAIGLAFQGTLSNFSAGVMLLIFRPFRVGDYVTVGGTSGTVEEIDLFTTELKTPDSKMIVMPNSSIFGAEITNFSAHENRRVDIDVGTDYGAESRSRARGPRDRPRQGGRRAHRPGAADLPEGARRLVHRLAGPGLVQERRLLGRLAAHRPRDQGRPRRGRIGIPFPQIGRAPRQGRRRRDQEALTASGRRPRGVTPPSAPQSCAVSVSRPRRMRPTGLRVCSPTITCWVITWTSRKQRERGCDVPDAAPPARR